MPVRPVIKDDDARHGRLGQCSGGAVVVMAPFARYRKSSRKLVLRGKAMNRRAEQIKSSELMRTTSERDYCGGRELAPAAL